MLADYPIQPTCESEAGITYSSACGTPIPDEGKRRPTVRTAEGHYRTLNIRAAQVTKCLLSVYEMIHKGQRAVFDLDGSYIEHKPSGERVKITWDNSSPVVNFEVLKPTNQHSRELTPMDSPAGSTASAQPMDTSDGSSAVSQSATGVTITPQPSPFSRQALKL